MNKPLLISSMAVAAGMLVIHEWRLSREIASARTQQAAMSEELKSMQERLQTLPQEIKERLDKAQSDLAMAEVRVNSMSARAAELERQLRALQAQAQAARTAAPPPASWTPAAPPPQATIPSEYTAVFPKRHRWGPEEVTGPPDTEGAGDIPTAWASWRSNGGPEWLRLDYDKAVNIAEVRIRETHNPGAITKVTAILASGQEVLLWEGTAVPAPAPNDFVVPVSQHVTASRIMVYLDSGRVPGWNEIDAVELVGKDGSRQWASNAAASSTYAEPQNRLGFSDGLEIEATPLR